MSLPGASPPPGSTWSALWYLERGYTDEETRLALRRQHELSAAQAREAARQATLARLAAAMSEADPEAPIRLDLAGFDSELSENMAVAKVKLGAASRVVYVERPASDMARMTPAEVVQAAWATVRSWQSESPGLSGLEAVAKVQALVRGYWRDRPAPPAPAPRMRPQDVLASAWATVRQLGLTGAAARERVKDLLRQYWGK